MDYLKHEQDYIPATPIDRLGVHNNIVVVTGVSASGKDFLLDRALSEAAFDEVGPYKRISLGAEIHNLMNIRFPNQYTGPLGLRDAPEAEMDKAADEVVDSIVNTPGLKIINCHVAYRGAESIQINPYHELKLMPKDYIVITAAPDEILHRRAMGERFRIREDVEIIDLHQKIGAAAVHTIAHTLGSGFTLINNHSSLINKNVAIMRKTLGVG